MGEFLLNKNYIEVVPSLGSRTTTRVSRGFSRFIKDVSNPLGPLSSLVVMRASFQHIFISEALVRTPICL